MDTATEQRTTKYITPGATFDLLDWWDAFWQDESDSVLDHVTFNELLTLAVFDDQLLQKHKAEGTDYSEISKTCKEVGGIMMIIRQRTLHIGFPCTEGVCTFIMQLSGGRPGTAIMYCVALAVTWEQNGGFGHDIPSMAWLLEMWNHGFKAGKEDIENGPVWIEAPEWGIPGPKHLQEMWDKQKVRRGELRSGCPDNCLDYITMEEK